MAVLLRVINEYPNGVPAEEPITMGMPIPLWFPPRSRSHVARILEDANFGKQYKTPGGVRVLQAQVLGRVPFRGYRAYVWRSFAIWVHPSGRIEAIEKPHQKLGDPT